MNQEDQGKRGRGQGAPEQRVRESEWQDCGKQQEREGSGARQGVRWARGGRRGKHMVRNARMQVQTQGKGHSF